MQALRRLALQSLLIIKIKINHHKDINILMKFKLQDKFKIKNQSFILYFQILYKRGFRN